MFRISLTSLIPLPSGVKFKGKYLHQILSAQVDCAHEYQLHPMSIPTHPVDSALKKWTIQNVFHANANERRSTFSRE